MCLLVVLSRVIPGAPLVVAANRDEWLDRPALAMTSLSEAPGIRGGRDERAGGTWLATSQSGLVAGLTNAPMIRPPTVPKRSRGELPLLLARLPGALEAARALQSSIRSEDFNPCWMLCGDRDALAYLDLSASGRPHVEPLDRGIHILENRPLGPSPKTDFVRALLGQPPCDLDALTRRLESLLASHEIPPRLGRAETVARPRRALHASTPVPMEHARRRSSSSPIVAPRASASRPVLPARIRGRPFRLNCNTRHRVAVEL